MAFRLEIEELLHHDATSSQFLRTEVPGVLSHEESGSASLLAQSNVIGPYKLLQLLGEGGMEAVYMAELSHPVRRIVAIKLIEGRRWRLTPADLKNHQPPNISLISPCDEISDSTEFEGFTMLDDEFCIFVTGSREDNVTIARLKVLSPEKT